MNLSNKSKFSFGNKLEICRLCLSFTKSCFSLIEDSESSGMLEALTSLRILPTDGISTIMCLKCYLNLKLAFTIQQNMLGAEQRFREHSFSTPIKQECDIQTIDSDEKSLKAEIHETKGIKDDQKKYNVEEYNCKVCDKKCPSKDSLRKHMTGVHVEVECPLCGKKYKKRCLKRHIEEIHNPQNEPVDFEKYICDICGVEKTTKRRLYEHKHIHVMPKCPICNEKFAKSQLKEHVKEHDISKAEVAKLAKNILEDYACEICGKVYSLKRLLNHHKYSVHLKEKCPICGKELSKAHLKEHIARHGVSSTKAIQVSNPDDAQKEPNANSPEKYVCDICGKKKFSLVDLRKHKYNVHVMAQCPICKKTISQTNIKRHIERHKGSRTICELCGISVLQHDLRVHMYNMHTVRKLKCNFCDKIFNKKHLRTMHEKIHHLGQADFTCDTCGKSFFKKRYLKTHIDSTHLKLRPHICEFCNVGFSSKIGLRTHRRQHTNERPYKCEFCGEGFRQNVSLKSHLKSQHDVKEELICECKKCGKKFASRAALLSHSRIH